jgi:hypothetical protein
MKNLALAVISIPAAVILTVIGIAVLDVATIHHIILDRE